MTDVGEPTTAGEGLRSLARALVEIPTENPPGNEAAAAAFVREWFEDAGIEAERLASPDPDRPQVGARVGRGDPTVVLNGHLDVVPVVDPEAWSVDPYGGVIRDGRLVGRGSADMKTNLAIAMLVARDLAAEIRSGTLSGSLVVHAAMGEESADPGTRTLLERGYDSDLGIVLEPTAFRVATSTKGLAVYRIAVGGEATHASHPSEGTNAIGKARRVLDAIDAYDADLRSGPDSLCGTALASVTEIEAGTGSNLAVVPERARLVLDRRVRPGESIQAVDAEVAALLEDLAAEGIDLEWERIQTYASSKIPTDHPLARRLRKRSVDAVQGGDSDDVSDDSDDSGNSDVDVSAPWGIEAATDMRNFVNDAGVPAVTWGPGELRQAHTVDESIDLAAAATGRSILEDVLEELLE